MVPEVLAGGGAIPIRVRGSTSAESSVPAYRDKRREAIRDIEIQVDPLLERRLRVRATWKEGRPRIDGQICNAQYRRWSIPLCRSISSPEIRLFEDSRVVLYLSQKRMNRLPTHASLANAKLFVRVP